MKQNDYKILTKTNGKIILKKGRLREALSEEETGQLLSLVEKIYLHDCKVLRSGERKL
jgi:hypothetical protein